MFVHLLRVCDKDFLTRSKRNNFFSFFRAIVTLQADTFLAVILSLFSSFWQFLFFLFSVSHASERDILVTYSE